MIAIYDQGDLPFPGVPLPPPLHGKRPHQNFLPEPSAARASRRQRRKNELHDLSDSPVFINEIPILPLRHLLNSLGTNFEP